MAPPQPTPTTLRLESLCATLQTAHATSPLNAADDLANIRRLLTDLPQNYDPHNIAASVVSLLRHDPSNLLLAHRAVAVLAHPTLSAARAPVESAVVAAMDRLAMSAAFQHTAMAALQNAASTSPHHERDAVVLAVVSAMRQHHSQNGVLLRGADLIAFHLNQSSAVPLTSTYRVASRIVVDTAQKLTATPQGASTALLALVAAARHASSLASFSGRPSSTTRFSRGNTASAIVDHQFAAAVAAAMARHPAYAPVQVLGCEVVRVAAAGATAVARLAAKELHSAGAASAIVAALQAHTIDVSVVDRALVALRSLLLGGGSHGRLFKPSLHVDPDLADYVARVADMASDSIAVKDRDLSSAAAVLAMDVRSATNSGINAGSGHGAGRGPRDRGVEGGRLSGLGRRIMRRIRFGQKQNWYDQEYDRYAEEHFTEKGADPVCPTGKDPALHSRSRRVSGRGSFSIMQGTQTYRRAASSQDVKDAAGGPDGAGGRVDVVMANRKMSEGGVLGDGADGTQITLSRKWRSVSGRWNQRGRRGSAVSTSVDAASKAAAAAAAAGATGGNPRRERRGPLTLSGSEMANLTRQPSRIFGGTAVDGAALRASQGDPRMTEGRPRFVSAGHEDYGF